MRKRVQKKMFLGYVLIHMVMNDDVWYVVRNTRELQVCRPRFLNHNLSEAEMRNMGIKDDNIVVDFEVGDTVTVVTEKGKHYRYNKQINPHKQIVTISVDLFGRETPSVEISFSDVRVSN